MAESITDLDLKDVDGIGPKTKEKLAEGGTESVLDLAVALPKEVEAIIGGSEENAFSIILSAKRLLEESGLLARESSFPLLRRCRDVKRCCASRARHPYESARFRVTEQGVADIDPSKRDKDEPKYS